MTVPAYKPNRVLYVAAGLSYWLIIAIMAWSFYQVIAG